MIRVLVETMSIYGHVLPPLAMVLADHSQTYYELSVQ
jgi:hypothetical protein